MTLNATARKHRSWRLACGRGHSVSVRRCDQRAGWRGRHCLFRRGAFGAAQNRPALGSGAHWRIWCAIL